MRERIATFTGNWRFLPSRPARQPSVSLSAELSQLVLKACWSLLAVGSLLINREAAAGGLWSRNKTWKMRKQIRLLTALSQPTRNLNLFKI